MHGPRLLVGCVVGAMACRYHFDPLDHGDATLTNDANDCGFTFCDDFDRPPPLEAGWDTPVNSGGATLQLSMDNSVSAPQSYMLGLPAPQLEVGMMVKRFPLTAASARVSLAMSYGSTTPGTAEVDLVRLRWDVPPAPCTSFGYYIVRDGTVPLVLQETYGGCGGNISTPLGTFDNGGFRKLDMTVTFGAVGTAHVRVDIDGANVFDQLTTHDIPPSPLTLEVGGAAVRNMSAPWLMNYDDVIVDLR